MIFRRFRQNRIDQPTRFAHRENFIESRDLILPLFIVEGSNVKDEIPSMKGVFHYSCDILCDELAVLVDKGLSSVLLFGVPSEKGIASASSSYGIVQRAIPLLKKRFPDLEVITDVCLCSFTEDGHCHTGDNDATCLILAEIALSHARAGADAVAPSDMMDGRVSFMRKALDLNGFEKMPVISYSAKFASSFYGPFRDAADCAPKSGSRKSYQMDPPNGNEAMLEIEADIEEGASSIIIKPAMSYLDIVSRAAQRFSCPVIAYNVSGEYAALLALIEKGLAREEIIYEVIVSMKRAGADRIITYHAPYLLENIDAFRSL